MSYYQDIYNISVRGSRENVIRMLNAAIRNVGNGNVIEENDDIEAINKKNLDEDGVHGLRVALRDLVDEQAMQDAELQQKKQKGCKPEEGFSTDARVIEIAKIKVEGEEYVIEMVMYTDEYSEYVDWLSWKDIARLYDVRIVIELQEFNKGVPTGNISTSIYEVVDGIVQGPDDDSIQVEEYEDDEPEHSAWKGLIDENGHAVIPDGTEEIIDFAFEKCENLVSIEIPGSVKSIGVGSFYGCSGLKSIVIPDSVNVIYDLAFKGCKSLASVVLPKGIQFEFDTFEGCPCEKDLEL